MPPKPAGFQSAPPFHSALEPRTANRVTSAGRPFTTAALRTRRRGAWNPTHLRRERSFPVSGMASARGPLRMNNQLLSVDAMGLVQMRPASHPGLLPSHGGQLSGSDLGVQPDSV